MVMFEVYSKIKKHPDWVRIVRFCTVKAVEQLLCVVSLSACTNMEKEHGGGAFFSVDGFSVDYHHGYKDSNLLSAASLSIYLQNVGKPV